MSDDTCILTPKDFTILEVMRDRCLGRDDPLAPLLRRKLESARVVFRDDVPASVATLNSRVSFRPGGGDPDTRILSNERMASPVGLSLSIATPRGLALLGLAEGEAFRLAGRDGSEEWIMLEKVQYQPEAARRDKELARGQASPARGKPVLRLIRGASVDRQAPAPVVYDTFDDPGPSAA
jgi:regulator of nucleoside diphosphate kinase